MSATDPTEPRYYAIVDPLDTGVITYWYRVRRGRAAGQLAPWPPKSSYRPLYRRDVPEDPAERQAFLDNWWGRLSIARAEIESAIDADPDTAAARFAALHTACSCGRPLTDGRSRVYGIGSDCRAGMPPAALDSFIAATGREHAERTS